MVDQVVKTGAGAAHEENDHVAWAGVRADNKPGTPLRLSHSHLLPCHHTDTQTQTHLPVGQQAAGVLPASEHVLQLCADWRCGWWRRWRLWLLLLEVLEPGKLLCHVQAWLLAGPGCLQAGDDLLQLLLRVLMCTFRQVDRRAR